MDFKFNVWFCGVLVDLDQEMQDILGCPLALSAPYWALIYV